MKLIPKNFCTKRFPIKHVFHPTKMQCKCLVGYFFFLLRIISLLFLFPFIQGIEGKKQCQGIRKSVHIFFILFHLFQMFTIKGQILCCCQDFAYVKCLKWGIEIWTACEMGYSLTSNGGTHPRGKMLVLLQIQSRIVNPSWYHFLQNKICLYLQNENYDVLLSLELYYSCIVIHSLLVETLSHPV